MAHDDRYQASKRIRANDWTGSNCFDQCPKTQTTESSNLIIEYGAPEVLRVFLKELAIRPKMPKTDVFDGHLSAYLCIALE